MTKKILIMMVALATSFAITAKANAAWSFQEFTDDFDGAKTFTAVSPMVSPLHAMDSPYNHVKSQMFYTCTNGQEDLGILFTVEPNLTSYDIHDGWNEYLVNVSWGGKRTKSLLKRNWNSNAIYFSIPDEELKDLKGASWAKIRFDWFRNGFPVFRYDLRGANKAIYKARALCGSKPVKKVVKQEVQVEATFDEVEEQNRAACAEIDNQHPMCEKFK